MVGGWAYCLVSCYIGFQERIRLAQYILEINCCYPQKNNTLKFNDSSALLCTGFRQDFLPCVKVDTKWIHIVR